MSKTLETSVEISGVLSPSLQSAIQKAVEGFNNMSKEALQAAGAGEKLAAQIKTEEAVLRSLERGYADFVVAGQEGTEEAQQLAQQIQTLSRELDGNRDQLEAAHAAAEKLAGGMGKTETESDKLRHTISEQESTLQQLKERYVALQLSEGDTTDESRELAQQIDRLSTELSENRQRLSDAERAADELDNSLEQVNDSAKMAEEGFTVFKATLANLAAEAIRSAINGLKDLAQTVIELGTETETSFAQLETISGHQHIDALKNSLTALSNETGIASSELAVTAYNAISAGTSAEDAAVMVETASKLAVAGFTDTDSALSVLTTAINSYGDSAGTATQIADSLITVQNLGVTTIDELSAAMGKAIATGSAYGVDLKNLESAYISLTKSGISTQESTTYLSSMLKELGDTGSDVSAIIQQQTGSSFTQLMENGSSLSDVLAIVYEALDEDSTAMMNLWGSAEAGKASNAIINQGLETFNENLLALADSTGATQSAYEVMADTLSTKTAIMKQHFANLGLEIFEKLKPALSSAVDYMTNSVEPAVEWALAHLPEIGVVIAGIGAAIVAVKWKSVLNLITKAKGVIKGISAALGGVSAPALTVIAAVTAVALAFMNLWRNNEEFRNKITAIWDGIKSKFDAFGQGITDRLNALGFEFKDITEVLKNVWDGFCAVLAPVFEGAFQIIGSVLGTALDVLTGLFDVFSGIFTGDWDLAWSGVKELFGGIWEGITSIFSVSLETLKGVADVFLGWFGTSWDELWSNVPGPVSKAWDTIKQVSTDAAGKISEFMTETFAPAASAAWEKIKATTEVVADFFKTTVLPDMQQIGHSIGQALKAGWELAKAAWDFAKPYFAALWSTIKAVWDFAVPFFSAVWEGIKDAFMPLVSVLGSFFRNAWEVIKVVWNVAASFFKTIFDTIAGIFSAVKSVLSGDFSSAWEAIKGIFSGWGSFFSGLWDSLVSIFGAVVSFFTDAFSGAWEAVKAIWQPVAEWFDSAVLQPIQSLFGGDSLIVSFFSNAWDSIKQIWNVATSFFQSIFDTIVGIFSAVKSVFSGDFSGAWEAIKGIFANWGSFFSGLWDAIVNIFANVGEFLCDVFSKALDGIKNTWQGVTGFFSGLWDGIKSGVSTAASTVGNVLSDSWESWKSNASTAWNGIKNVVSGAWDGIKSGVSTAASTVGNVLSDSWESWKSGAGSAWDTISSKTSSAWDKIKSAISDKVNAAKSTVSSVFNGIKSTISSTLSGALSSVQNVFNNIKTSITDKINAAKTAVSNAIGSIKNAFNFSWSLPKLKLPHISISGGFSLSPPSVPHFGIEWYKKGGILTEPTIFGAAGNNLLAGGEAGAEAVLPLAVLWDKLESILRAILRSDQPMPESDPDTSLLQKAGQLLTLDDFSLGSLANTGGTVIYYDFSGFTWSPQIQNAGGSDGEGDFMDELRAHEAEFFDWLEEFIKMREVAQYA